MSSLLAMGLLDFVREINSPPLRVYLRVRNRQLKQGNAVPMVPSVRSGLAESAFHPSSTAVCGEGDFIVNLIQFVT